MLALLLLTGGIEGSCPGGCQAARPATAAPAPDWTAPTADELREAAEADRAGARMPGSGEIGFSFTLPESARATSAGVYDSGGRLIRTLWSARPYPAGAHRALWDGRDDYGKPATQGRYTVKLLYGNVRYDWDGVIGVTEDSPAGPRNWDATASFPSSLAFLGGKGYVAGGYNEGKIEAFVFNEKTPYTVAPLNMALFSGGQFEYAATDGERVYFAALHYCCEGSDAVVAFTPDGAPYSFAQGTEIPPMGRLGAYFVNTQMHPALALKGVRGVDVASYKSEVLTGLAVERNGRLLATAHGGRGGNRKTASLDEIRLWDKRTGAALGAIKGVPSPQKMAFDLSGDLWAIEGGPVSGWHWDAGARLVRIHDPGGRSEIAEPIAGLDNPVDVAVSPVNGHLFVADGGASQQVKEFDPATGRLLATVGTAGGYGQGAACNATMTPTTWWLDFNGRGTGFTQPWIAIDDGGDLWVGDFTASRMQQFHGGKYVRQIEISRFNYLVSAPRRSPTRVFAGPAGMLEYQVRYGVPIEPGDPTAAGGNGAWKAVRNWYPCFLAAEAGQQASTAAQLETVETLPNGNTYGLVGYHGGPFTEQNALVSLPESGRIAVANNRITAHKMVGLDADGSFYRAARDGDSYTIRRFAVTGYDAQGFPEWDRGTAIAHFTLDAARGDPLPACWYDGCDFAPSAGGVIPIFAGPSFNKAVAAGEPAFHLGGLPVGGDALAWAAMPERPIRYPDGRGTYTTDTREPLGYEARAIGHDIFAGVNGNWQQFACQFYHYRDDGLLVGQFGWRGSDAYTAAGRGRTDPWQGEPLTPGFCGNPQMCKVVEVGGDYYLYNPDEGYRAGIHRWHLSNLASVHELAGTTELGAPMLPLVRLATP